MNIKKELLNNSFIFLYFLNKIYGIFFNFVKKSPTFFNGLNKKYRNIATIPKSIPKPKLYININGRKSFNQ